MDPPQEKGTEACVELPEVAVSLDGVEFSLDSEEAVGTDHSTGDGEVDLIKAPAIGGDGPWNGDLITDDVGNISAASSTQKPKIADSEDITADKCEEPTVLSMVTASPPAAPEDEEFIEKTVKTGSEPALQTPGVEGKESLTFTPGVEGKESLTFTSLDEKDDDAETCDNRVARKNMENATTFQMDAEPPELDTEIVALVADEISFTLGTEVESPIQPEQEDLEVAITSLKDKADKEEEDDFEFAVSSALAKPPDQASALQAEDNEFDIFPDQSTTVTVTETSKTVLDPIPIKSVTRTQTTVTTTEESQLSLLIANGLVDTSASHKPTVDDKKADNLHAAEAEWDAVHIIEPRTDSDAGQQKAVDAVVQPLMSFNEALQYCQTTSNLDQYKSQIKTSITRRGLAAFSHFLFGPPKLHRDLHEERNLVFCIAAWPLSNEEEIHIRVLQTIYRKLTGSKFDCQRFGHHWEQIGFQGNDPATDLRGCGFLALLQLLYFVMDPKTLPLARDIYRLSCHESQNFPFCIMGINLTRLVLMALREDALNKECNRRKQVFGLLNDYYVGCYLHLYTIWKQQHKTIADSGFVIKDLETFSKKKPQVILKNLEAHLQQRKDGSMVGAGEPLNFAGVGELDDGAH